MIGRPGQLGIARIPGPHVEHAIDHEHPAGLGSFWAGSVALAALRTDVDAPEVSGRADDLGETQAQLFLRVGLEAVAIAIGGVLTVVAPRHRPVIAAVEPCAPGDAARLSDDGRWGRELHTAYHLAGRIGRSDKGLHQWIEEDLLQPSPKPLALGSIAQQLAVAHDDQVQAGNDQQNLVAGAGPGIRIAGNTLPDAVEVRPPPQPRSRLRVPWWPVRQRRARVGHDFFHPGWINELLPLPVPIAQHQPPDACGSPGAVLPAAPVGIERQAINLVPSAVANEPVALRHADGVHDPLLEQRSDVRLGSAFKAGRDGIRQSRHARIAVGILRAGREDHRCLVDGDGEGI